MSLERSHSHAATANKKGSDEHRGAKPGKQTEVDKDKDDDTVAGVDLSTLQQFVGKHEGNIDHVYLDSRGFKTAGIGHLLHGTSWRVGQKVSKEQVAAWFKADIAKSIAGAQRKIGGAYGGLTEARKMVVIDMVFNLGEAGFGAFEQTIAAIRSGHYAHAASRMLDSLWAKQVGNRAIENASIMRSGHFAGGGGGTVRDDDKDNDKDDRKDHDKDKPKHDALEVVRVGARVLRFGDSGPAVVKLQRMLHATPDGDFGPKTQAAVMKFQKKHHLVVDGIVGPKTVAALDRAEHHKDNRDKDDDKDDDQKAHDKDEGKDKDKDRDKDDDKKGGDSKWTRAPKLADVKDGDATLHVGHEGGSVRHVQKLLGVETDGKFGPGTRSAVKDFQDERDMKVQNGVIDDHVLRVLERHPAGSVEGESRQGSAQRMRMLGVARAGGSGRPDGRCYYHVCQFFIRCGGYGKIKNPYTQFPSGYLPLAHHFADLMNSTGPKKWGLDRLSMDSPYDAPAGAIVVVAAGSPGTAHPTAGDIAVADGNGRFYNGGLMGYSGPAGWNASRSAKLLGVYIPI